MDAISPMFGRSNSAPGKVTPSNMYNPNQQINTVGGSAGAPSPYGNTMGYGNEGMKSIGPSFMPNTIQNPNANMQLGNANGQPIQQGNATIQRGGTGMEPTEMLRRMMMGMRF